MIGNAYHGHAWWNGQRAADSVYAFGQKHFARRIQRSLYRVSVINNTITHGAKLRFHVHSARRRERRVCSNGTIQMLALKFRWRAFG